MLSGDSPNIQILTGYGSIATALDAVRFGANHYLSKPVDVDQILAAYETVDSSGAGQSSPLPRFPAWPESSGNISSES